jgi:hypothetical protein
MHSSGKLVQMGLITDGKTRGLSSTYSLRYSTDGAGSSVKPAFIHELIPFFTQYFSPLKLASPPLIEHYFYPVNWVKIVFNQGWRGKF